MYNLYTYEKRKKEEEKNRLQLSTDAIKRHKKKLSKMANNYKERVLNFITNMTIPGCLVKVNDNIQITNTREQLMKDTTIKKAFIFKGYKTEKERIEDNLKNNIFLSGVYEKPKRYQDNTKKKTNIHLNVYQDPSMINSINSKPLVLPHNHHEPQAKGSSIIQPEMRFKPRSDMERVFDELNASPSFGKLNYKILHRHLSKLNLNKPLVDEQEDDEDDDFGQDPNDSYRNLMKYASLHQKYLNKLKTSSGINKKGIVLVPPIHNSKTITTSEDLQMKTNESLKKQYASAQRKLGLNKEAKKIMSDLHFKTHFKATAEIASQGVIRKLAKKSFHMKKSETCNDFDFNIEEDDNIANAFRKEREALSCYTKNLNPYKINKTEPNDKKLKILNELILKQSLMSSNDNENALNRLSKNDTIEPTNNNDLILVGNKMIPRSNIDIIAKEVLNQCNVYHSKSNNNNTRLKSKKGKLMITKGLTVKDFKIKYNL